MAEFKYQFKAVNDQKMISGSKIFNIIDGFPSDYSEQTALIYGKLKTLFGDPLQEEKDRGNQYTYGVVTTTEDGREIFLHAYRGFLRELRLAGSRMRRAEKQHISYWR